MNTLSCTEGYRLAGEFESRGAGDHVEELARANGNTALRQDLAALFMTQILFMSDTNIIRWTWVRTNPMLWVYGF
jgi:hypothetical protein